MHRGRESVLPRRAHHLHLQCGRLRTKRDERCIQAQEQALETDQQSLPRNPTPRLLPERLDSVQGHRKMPEVLRLGHHDRRSRDPRENSRRYGLHDLEQRRVQEIVTIAVRDVARNIMTNLVAPRASTPVAMTRTTILGIMTITKADANQVLIPPCLIPGVWTYYPR